MARYFFVTDMIKKDKTSAEWDESDPRCFVCRAPGFSFGRRTAKEEEGRAKAVTAKEESYLFLVFSEVQDIS